MAMNHREMYLAVNREFAQMLRNLKEMGFMGSLDDTLHTLNAVAVEACTRQFSVGIEHGARLKELSDS
jgi:hypothetical protein